MDNDDDKRLGDTFAFTSMVLLVIACVCFLTIELYNCYKNTL